MEKKIVNTDAFKEILARVTLNKGENLLEHIVAVVDYDDGGVAFAVYEHMGNMFLSILVNQNGGEEFFIRPLHYYEDFLFDTLNKQRCDYELYLITDYIKYITYYFTTSIGSETEEETFKELIALLAYAFFTDAGFIQHILSSTGEKIEQNKNELDYLFMMSPMLEKAVFQTITMDDNLLLTDNYDSKIIIVEG